MSENICPTISPVPGRVRWPPWTLHRLCVKSYFDAYLAPKLRQCLFTYNNVLKSDDPQSSEMHHEIIDAERGIIDDLDTMCSENLKLYLLYVSFLVNAYEITSFLLHINVNTHNELELAYNYMYDREIIMRLIREADDVNCVLKETTNYLDTPLHRACWRNDFDMVELLLQHGACLVPEDKYMVINAAAEWSDARIMILLLGQLTDVQRAVALKPIEVDTGHIWPFETAIMKSNWECFNVLVQAVPGSWFNDQKLSFTILAENIITGSSKCYEPTNALNHIGDYTDFNLGILDYKIYNGLRGKDSLLLRAINHHKHSVVEFLVRNYLQRLETLSLQTALEAALQSRCKADVINNILKYLPETDRCDVQTITKLYRSSGHYRPLQSRGLLYIASTMGITAHFTTLLHKYRAQADLGIPYPCRELMDRHGPHALFDNLFLRSPLSTAVLHPCLWPVFTQTSTYGEMDRRGYNLTELAHRYGMFPCTYNLCVPNINFSEAQQTWVNTEQAQVHVTQPYFSHIMKSYQIMPVWDSKTGAANQIITGVTKVLNEVSCHMLKKIPFLAFDVLLSGSSHENTKAVVPDELDFILPLTLLSMFITVQNNSTTIPYVSVEPDTSLTDMLNKHKLLNEQGNLQMNDLCYLFKTEFWKCLSLMKVPAGMGIHNKVYNTGPLFKSYKPFVLKIQWLGEMYGNINMTVDLVPAFVMTDTNKQSMATHVKNKIEKLNLSGSNMYAILKENMLYRNQLRLSFSVHEAALIKQASVAARQGYTLAKCLRHRRICPKVQLPYSSKYMEAEQSVCTYALKSCFIALLRERRVADAHDNSTADSIRHSENIISVRSITWAKMIYAKMEENLTRYGKVPHIFYEDWDVYFGENHPMDFVNSPRDQMLADRKISLTLLHCKIITNMLNTLPGDLKFSSTKDSKVITQRDARTMMQEVIMYICLFGLFILFILFFVTQYLIAPPFHWPWSEVSDVSNVSEISNVSDVGTTSETLQ